MIEYNKILSKQIASPQALGEKEKTMTKKEVNILQRFIDYKIEKLEHEIEETKKAFEINYEQKESNTHVMQRSVIIGQIFMLQDLAHKLFITNENNFIGYEKKVHDLLIKAHEMF